MVHGGGGARRWWQRGARTQIPEGPSLPGLADRPTCPIAALRHTTWLGLITIPRGSFFLELFLDGQAQWWYVRSIQHSQRCTSTTGDRLADDHGGGGTLGRLANDHGGGWYPQGAAAGLTRRGRGERTPTDLAVPDRPDLVPQCSVPSATRHPTPTGSPQSWCTLRSKTA